MDTEAARVEEPFGDHAFRLRIGGEASEERVETCRRDARAQPAAFILMAVRKGAELLIPQMGLDELAELARARFELPALLLPSAPRVLVGEGVVVGERRFGERREVTKLGDHERGHADIVQAHEQRARVVKGGLVIHGRVIHPGLELGHLEAGLVVLGAHRTGVTAEGDEAERLQPAFAPEPVEPRGHVLEEQLDEPIVVVTGVQQAQRQRAKRWA